MPGSPSGSSSTGGLRLLGRRRRAASGPAAPARLRTAGAGGLRELVALPSAERLLFLARDILRIWLRACA